MTNPDIPPSEKYGFVWRWNYIKVAKKGQQSWLLRSNYSHQVGKCDNRNQELFP